MPIQNSQCKDGIFFCEQVGEVNEQDAYAWVQQIQDYAADSMVPLVAFMDATNATYITAKARQIFARASAMTELAGIAIVATRHTVVQSCKLIAMLSVDPYTRVFDTVAEARQYARKRASHVRAAYERDNPQAKH